MQLRSILVISLTLSLTGFENLARASSAFSVLQCPAVGDQYEQMLAKLETIKTSLKDKANCYRVATQVDSLQKLLDSDRQKVLGIVDHAGGAPLSADDTKVVHDYAEGLTKKVAGLNDLFLNSRDCFSGDAADKQLSSLSGFVNEAAQLVGAVAGPWGVPIALGGSVVAGFLSGLDQVLKSRTGFDFNKREQWLAYVQNLCTYHSYRGQIDHLIDPAGKIARLQNLKKKLDDQLTILLRDCSDCRTLQMTYEARKSIQLYSNLQSPDVVAVDGKFTKPLGSYTLQTLGLRDWASDEIRRVLKDANSDWGNPSGQYLLSRATSEIEAFLYNREAPEFLAFQTNQAQTDYADFQTYNLTDGKALYSQIQSVGPQAFTNPTRYIGWNSDPLEVFHALITNPIHWETLPTSQDAIDLKFAWRHYHDQVLIKLRTAQTSSRVATTFCTFFRQSGDYTPEIRSECSSSWIRKIVVAETQLVNELGLVPPTPDPEDSQLATDPLDALTKAVESRM